MYAVINNIGRIIALHDDKKVVKRYVESVDHYHKITLDIIKVKKRAVKEIHNYEDLYLVRYGDTYVQAGYLTYIDLEYGGLIEDLRYARDILLRTLEMEKLRKGEVKALEKSVMVFDKLLREQERYTPNESELKNIKEDVEMMRTNMYFDG